MTIEDLFKPADPDEAALNATRRTQFIEHQSEAEFSMAVEDNLAEQAKRHGVDLSMPYMQIHAQLLRITSAQYRELAQSRDITEMTPDEFADALGNIIENALSQVPEATLEHRAALVHGFLKAAGQDYIERHHEDTLNTIADPNRAMVIDMSDMSEADFEEYLAASNAKAAEKFSASMPAERMTPIADVTNDLAVYWRNLQQSRDIGEMTAKQFREWLDETVAALKRDHVDTGRLPEHDWKLGEEGIREAMAATWQNLRANRG